MLILTWTQAKLEQMVPLNIVNILRNVLGGVLLGIYSIIWSFDQIQCKTGRCSM